MKAAREFFQDVVTELNKVSWPTRIETIRMTGIVIITTIIVAAYVGGIDYSLTKLIEGFIR